MKNLNNRGFAITTIVYSIVILLLVMILTLFAVLRQEYGNQRDYITDINDGLNECLRTNTC